MSTPRHTACVAGFLKEVIIIHVKLESDGKSQSNTAAGKSTFFLSTDSKIIKIKILCYHLFDLASTDKFSTYHRTYTLVTLSQVTENGLKSLISLKKLYRF